MLTVRCTRRLLTRLRATPSSEAATPTTRLGDWYAGIVSLRKPLAIFMSERTVRPRRSTAATMRSTSARLSDAAADIGDSSMAAGARKNLRRH